MAKFANGVAIVLLVILPVSGCVAPMPYSYETKYAGNGVGKIEKRVEFPSAPIAYRQDGSPATVPVLIGKQFVEFPGPRYPGRIRYEIRGNDGTLHILSSDFPVEVGACVAFAGFADGPSRTHWSFGRVRLERSKNCD